MPITYLNSINWFFFIMKTVCVLCELRPKTLCTIQMNFSLKIEQGPAQLGVSVD
jgi:hypothetical protein